MKNISEIRFQNAKALAATFSSNAEFARALGMSDAYMWQILGDKKVRNIGSSIARRMERACNKPDGWLDTDHSAQSPVEKTKTSRKTGSVDISDEALEVAKAFDLLENSSQKEAVFSQLRAFGVLK